MEEFFNFIFILFFFFCLGYGIFKVCTHMNQLECDKWGGDYNWASGCLLQYEGKMVDLQTYKTVVATSIMQPIPTNKNINLELK